MDLFTLCSPVQMTQLTALKQATVTACSSLAFQPADIQSALLSLSCPCSVLPVTAHPTSECHQAVKTSNCRTSTQLCSEASAAISSLTIIYRKHPELHGPRLHGLTTTNLPSTPSSPKWSLSFILFVYTSVRSRLSRGQ
jgi:hypothetical protein